ncbi:MAG: protein arginine kinase [candidate division Zixibacteria bacterium]|nr:protein arginine kinase [candidate division Zixibacteria bacterium]
MFEELIKKPAAWLTGEGKNSEIVLSSRVRLARNISSIPFPSVAIPEEREKIISFVNKAVQKSSFLNGGKVHNSSEIPKLDKDFLVERHLVSPEFMRGSNNKALYIGEEEKISLMINEEDHVRIQALNSGLEIKSTFELADKVDTELSNTLEFNFDPDFGYLTSCPTNAGTGMRASVLIHLPGLVLTKEIENVISQVTKLGLTVRGFYGEGSDVLGNLFQISNQTTLGKSEEDLIESLEKVTNQIIEYENNSRKTLYSEAKEQIEDKIWRAFGILRSARVITSTEVTNLLSALRLGLGMGTIKEIPLGLINQILLISFPAHLQKYLNKEMEPNERDILRAELIREKLKSSI